MDKHRDQPLRGFRLTPDDAPLLETLSSEHKRILELAEDLTYPGVAQALDIPTGTVRSRLNRARTALVKARDDRDAAASYEDVTRNSEGR